MTVGVIAVLGVSQHCRGDAAGVAAAGLDCRRDETAVPGSRIRLKGPEGPEGRIIEPIEEDARDDRELLGAGGLLLHQRCESQDFVLAPAVLRLEPRELLRVRRPKLREALSGERYHLGNDELGSGVGEEVVRSGKKVAFDRAGRDAELPDEQLVGGGRVEAATRADAELLQPFRDLKSAEAFRNHHPGSCSGGEPSEPSQHLRRSQIVGEQMRARREGDQRACQDQERVK